MSWILGHSVAGMVITIFAGLVMGSFASMLCYRLPRDIPVLGWKGSGEKPVHYGFSFCPSCEHKLTFFDLVPIFSYLFSKGRCRHCQQAIPKQYPIIEILTLGLTLLAYAFLGISLEGAIVMVAAPILVSLFVIDWQFKILPNVLNFALFITGFVYQIFFSDHLLFYLISALVYPASMVFIRWVFLKVTGKDGLGFGDIKFFAAAGVWLGLEVFSAYLLMSSLLGVVFGLLHKAITKEEVFPFGPALIVGFLICFYTKDLILTVL